MHVSVCLQVSVLYERLIWAMWFLCWGKFWYMDKRTIWIDWSRVLCIIATIFFDKKKYFLGIRVHILYCTVMPARWIYQESFVPFLFINISVVFFFLLQFGSIFQFPTKIKEILILFLTKDTHPCWTIRNTWLLC